MPFTKLNRMPLRFTGTASMIADGDVAGALNIAVDRLRRGFAPAVCPFEPWFGMTDILADLDGLRPDHLDSNGSGWNLAQQFEALDYAFLTGKNLRIYLELLVGRLRKRHGPQWQVHLDRLRRLREHRHEVKHLNWNFRRFDPAAACLEFQLIQFLLEWVEGMAP